MFPYLEGLDLAGDLASLPGYGIDIGWVISFIVGNVVDAAINGARAAIWPLAWVTHFGIGLRSAVLLGGAWLGYRLARPTILRAFPRPSAPLELIRSRSVSALSSGSSTC